MLGVVSDIVISLMLALARIVKMKIDGMSGRRIFSPCLAYQEVGKNAGVPWVLLHSIPVVLFGIVVGLVFIC